MRRIAAAWRFSGGRRSTAKPAAVFSFSVQKKKSHFAVNYCCFPDVSQTGNATFSTGNAGLIEPRRPKRGRARGNFQTTTDWLENGSAACLITARSSLTPKPESCFA